MNTFQILVRPRRKSWEVREGDVAPIFKEREHAISYARHRATWQRAEIVIMDASGAVVETIPAAATLAKMVSFFGYESDLSGNAT